MSNIAIKELVTNYQINVKVDSEKLIIPLESFEILYGFKSIDDIYELINIKEQNDWYDNNSIAIVLKTDNYIDILYKLKYNNINYKEHIDLGLTSVEPGSHCGVVFFTDKDLFKNEKLL